MKFSRLKKAGFMDKVFYLNHKELYPGVKAYTRLKQGGDLLQFPSAEERLDFNSPKVQQFMERLLPYFNPYAADLDTEITNAFIKLQTDMTELVSITQTYNPHNATELNNILDSLGKPELKHLIDDILSNSSVVPIGGWY